MIISKMTKEEAQKAIKDIKESRCASFWLQTTLRTALDRDIVDALHDAQTLTMILTTIYSN